MSLMEDLAEPLIRQGLVDPAAVVGCSDEEIAELMRAQGVGSLPRSYRDFLAYTGKNPYWLSAAEWDYKWILEEGKGTALEVAAERQLDAARFADAFVFETHEGYMFSYFRAEDLAADDPPYFVVGGRALIDESDRTFSELLSRLAAAVPERVRRDAERSRSQRPHSGT